MLSKVRNEWKTSEKVDWWHWRGFEGCGSTRMEAPDVDCEEWEKIVGKAKAHPGLWYEQWMKIHLQIVWCGRWSYVCSRCAAILIRITCANQYILKLFSVLGGKQCHTLSRWQWVSTAYLDRNLTHHTLSYMTTISNLHDSIS